MKTKLERILEKHNENVKQHARSQDRRQKAIDVLVRAESALKEWTRAVARSSKALQAERAAERAAKRNKKADSGASAVDPIVL